MAFIRNISTPALSDLEKIKAYKDSSDIKMLGALYEPYMDLVYGVCLKYFREPERAKDAVMQIFEELLVKITRYEIDNFRSWLYTLAKNHCLMQLRSPKNLKTVEYDASLMQSGEDVHLHSMFDKEENFQKMEQCLQKLSPDQKESVELFYLKNKCYKEISFIMGKDFNQVRSLIQNAKRNLKICMENNAEIKV